MADLRACGAVVQALKISNPIVSPWRSDLVPELVRTAINEARHLAAADLEVARRTGLPRAIGAALRTVAACEPDARAVDLLGEAVEVLTGSPAVLELARVLLDRGAALRRLRHPVEAREPLREALEIATRCGAMTLAERAHAEALLAGARPRRARLTGIHALTPGELRVARLAADGRSNREIAEALFLTTKTVKDHLGSCYGKLSIASRDELTRTLSQPEP
jgi:DNA-binding CsgD family transcriptional regulator